VVATPSCPGFGVTNGDSVLVECADDELAGVARSRLKTTYGSGFNRQPQEPSGSATNHDLATNARVTGQFRTTTSIVEQISPIISGCGSRVPGGVLNGCTDGCTTPRFATVRLCLRAPTHHLSELNKSRANSYLAASTVSGSVCRRGRPSDPRRNDGPPRWWPLTR
jgi:hypothetical protein